MCRRSEGTSKTEAGGSAGESGQARVYQIRIRGRLGPEWEDWFEGLTVTNEAQGDTLLTGPLTDQAALYGVLRKVRDLGMPLLAVACAATDEDSRRHDGKLEEQG